MSSPHNLPPSEVGGAAVASHQIYNAPDKPGVYLHKNAGGDVIYVGKAIALKKRLKSYLKPAATNPPRQNELIQNIHSVEYLTVDNEQEAFLLENTLIKKHAPLYNIQLKDGKSYPYIKIDLKDDFPRVYVTRQRTDKKALYFGPYSTPDSVRRTTDLLNRLFKYRTCKMKITGDEPKPCLEYYIDRCVAPCTGYASQEEYKKIIEQVVVFLRHGPSKVTRSLTQQMNDASAREAYEEALAIKKKIDSINKIAVKQTVAGVTKSNFDAIAVISEAQHTLVEVFQFRYGALIGRSYFPLQGAEDTPKAKILEEFIKQHYSLGAYIPRQIVCEEMPSNGDSLQNWLSEQDAQFKKFHVPQRGQMVQILNMVKQNARQSYQQYRIKHTTALPVSSETLELLQEQLDLPALPRRIECYDVSHIQGNFVVASMVVFKDGQPSTKDYRRFHLSLDLVRNDDFQSMRETLLRRLKYLKKDEADKADAADKADKSDEADAADKANAADKTPTGFRETPDLILIDGGKGQLSAAYKILDEAEMAHIPLAALAKKREQVYTRASSLPLAIPADSPAMYLLQNLRDEAHRFAIRFHRSIRSKASVKSALDQISGIGPERKKNLMRKFGSIAKLKQATLEEIASTKGITYTLGVKIKESL